jgi:uncharacterized protein YciI
MGHREAGDLHGRAPGAGREGIVGAAGYCPAMAIFALTTDHGPRWDASRGIREQEGWEEHAAFMDGLASDGFILAGGPLGDGEHTLHMVDATDEREVAARMGEDPWAAMELLRVGALQRWSIWLGRPPPRQR